MQLTYGLWHMALLMQVLLANVVSQVTSSLPTAGCSQPACVSVAYRVSSSDVLVCRLPGALKQRACLSPAGYPRVACVRAVRVQKDDHCSTQKSTLLYQDFSETTTAGT